MTRYTQMPKGGGANAKYDPSKRPVKTFGSDGFVYDSGLECRYAETLTMLGRENIYRNRFAILSFEMPGGQYKPDFLTFAPDGSMEFHEVKGYRSAKAEAAARLMRSLVKKPGNNVSKFYYAWSGGNILWFDEKSEDEGEPGAFYKCRDCGYVGIYAKDHHCCDKCGSERMTLICEDFNNWFNEEFKKQWGPNWEKWQYEYNQLEAATDEAKELTKKLKRRVEHLAKTHWQMGLVKQTEHSKNLSFLTKFAFNGTYIPDYYYEEPWMSVSRYGTALSPLVLVLVEQNQDVVFKFLVKQLKYFVNDKECPVVKLVHIDKNGIHVYDGYSDGFRDGSMYECAKCEMAYFAADDTTQCPCCGCEAVSKVSKEKGEDNGSKTASLV